MQLAGFSAVITMDTETISILSNVTYCFPSVILSPLQESCICVLPPELSVCYQKQHRKYLFLVLVSGLSNFYVTGSLDLVKSSNSYPVPSSRRLTGGSLTPYRYTYAHPKASLPGSFRMASLLQTETQISPPDVLFFTDYLHKISWRKRA